MRTTVERRRERTRRQGGSALSDPRRAPRPAGPRSPSVAAAPAAPDERPYDEEEEQGYRQPCKVASRGDRDDHCKGEEQEHGPPRPPPPGLPGEVLSFFTREVGD